MLHVEISIGFEFPDFVSLVCELFVHFFARVMGLHFYFSIFSFNAILAIFYSQRDSQRSSTDVIAVRLSSTFSPFVVEIGNMKLPKLLEREC